MVHNLDVIGFYLGFIYPFMLVSKINSLVGMSTIVMYKIFVK